MAAFGSSLNNNPSFADHRVYTEGGARRPFRIAEHQGMPYVESARAIGASDLRIMLRHLLPNTFASLICGGYVSHRQRVLIEASLSFLGVGLPADVILLGSHAGRRRSH